MHMNYLNYFFLLQNARKTSPLYNMFSNRSRRDFIYPEKRDPTLFFFVVVFFFWLWTGPGCKTKKKVGKEKISLCGEHQPQKRSLPCSNLMPLPSCVLSLKHSNHHQHKKDLAWHSISNFQVVPLLCFISHNFTPPAYGLRDQKATF